MDLQITSGMFSHITEIWGNNPNQIEAVTDDHKRYRITAQQNIRSGATENYWARYEIKVDIENPIFDLPVGTLHYMWLPVDMPWQNGLTPEECLKGALRWVQDRAEHRARGRQSEGKASE